MSLSPIRVLAGFESQLCGLKSLSELHGFSKELDFILLKWKVVRRLSARECITLGEVMVFFY